MLYQYAIAILSVTTMPKHANSKLPLYRKKSFLWAVGSTVTVILLVLLAFRLSPWPGAFIIRTVFNHNGSKVLKAMQDALPDYPVTVLQDEQYRAGDNAAKLDVYIPQSVENTDQQLPIVMWTHGGAWLSGDKKDAGPYFARLANEGFVVVSVNYGLAPGSPYPTAVHQLNDAHAYVIANAARFHGNPNKIILAGDSAGANLSSQMAALATNPAYAQEVNITPALNTSNLAAVLLWCGIYQMEGLATNNPTLPKIVSWGDKVTVWAYTGTRDTNSPLIRQMSPYYHVTSAFPATFISGGNGDPLTKVQSMPLAEKLSGLGVPLTTLFYADDHTPSLPHEYQFTFNTDGEAAFVTMVQFLKNLQ